MGLGVRDISSKQNSGLAPSSIPSTPYNLQGPLEVNL